MSDARRRRLVFMCASALVFSLLAACKPSAADLAAVDYAPRPGSGWKTSTPQEQGLDPSLVARLYHDASRLKDVYGVLVIKNGCLIGERYFDPGSREQQVNVHSVTKSINAAMVGIALEKGCLTSLDQTMMELFPELQDRITDPRKNRITIRQMLQMRAGYPWEESTGELMTLLFSGFRASTLVDVPLVRYPGTGFEYSNLTAHLLGLIVARACGQDLRSFAQENLFTPLRITPGFWQTDWEGNYLGFSDLHLSTNDLAKFGLMYLDDGRFDGQQVVPAAWVHDSLQVYSENAWKFRVGRNWRDNGYGYQWWSVRAGNHRYHLAWGHGGQQIALVDALDLVIAVTVDPLHGQHGGGPWKIEKSRLNLVADFIASLPEQ